MAVHEGAYEHVPLASAGEYGDAYSAAVAMLVVASGAAKELPTVDYVHAFSRRTPGDGDNSHVGLGTAMSFHDRGMEVRYQGMVDPDVLRREHPAAGFWADTLASAVRSEVETELPPKDADLLSLLNDPAGSWSVLMQVHAGALRYHDASVKPVVVMGHTARSLIVHNPSGHRLRGIANQRISLAASFGGEAPEPQVSLVAVRQRNWRNDGTIIGR